MSLFRCSDSSRGVPPTRTPLSGRCQGTCARSSRTRLRAGSWSLASRNRHPCNAPAGRPIASAPAAWVTLCVRLQIATVWRDELSILATGQPHEALPDEQRLAGLATCTALRSIVFDLELLPSQVFCRPPPASAPRPIPSSPPPPSSPASLERVHPGILARKAPSIA